MSLDEIQSEDREGNGVCLHDMLYSSDDNPSKYLIEACFARLAQAEKTIINQLIFGWTQQEIADSLGISQSTVSRCLLKFKNLIQEEKKL